MVLISCALVVMSSASRPPRPAISAEKTSGMLTMKMAPSTAPSTEPMPPTMITASASMLSRKG
ncbi:hypothetical protein D9M68_696650 [compost metagenome]